MRVTEERMPEVLGVGATIDVCFYGELLVAIQTGAYPVLNPEHNGRLLVIELKDDKSRVIGKLENIGSARQIEIQGDIAYITSREDGLYIVDLKDPAVPQLLCHWMTTEYATGIAVRGDLLVVSMRQYGLELLNIHDPAHPKFLSIARTGEAQSVWLDGHWAYAGVWGTKELVVVDIGDPANARVVSRTPLDGRGDGVCVRNGLCFAATGQHAREPAGVLNPDPSAWQKKGNGLEIFDVTDPVHPRHLSTVKFPLYYGLTFDMWDVQLSGNLALVSDTRNGFFFVDITDISAPQVLERIVLPEQPDGTCEPVGGFAFLGNRLALAGAGADVYVYSLKHALEAPETEAVIPDFRREKAPLTVEWTKGEPAACRAVWTGCNVRDIEPDGKRLFVSCAEDGIGILDAENLTETGWIRTAGNVTAVRYRKPYLYSAEDIAGLAVYREEEGVFHEILRLNPNGRAISDLEFSGDGRFLMVQCASMGVLMYDMSRPECPQKAGEKLDFIGLFYGRNFPYAGYGDCCWLGVNREGIVRVGMNEDGMFTDILEAPHVGVGPASGLDISGDTLIVNSGSGICRMDLADSRNADRTFHSIRGAVCPGKPRQKGDRLVITERAEGIVSFCQTDTDSKETVCIRQMRTSASVDLALIQEERVLIPGGRQGLLVVDRPFEKEK